MKRFEIFRPGRHTAASGVTLNFSEADLQAAVAAYDPAVHEAPIVVGHPKDNAPAYGWVGSLSFGEGGAIEASPIQVDPAFAEMVQAGRFKKRSVSWYVPGSTNHPLAGKPGHESYYPRHVAFLGAQPPAVKGLKEVAFSEEDGTVEFSDSFATSITARLFRSMREWIISDKGVDAADKVVPDYLIGSLEEAARAESQPAPQVAYHEEDPMNIAELQAQITTLTAENATLKAQASKVANFAEADATLKTREAAVAAAEAKITRAAVEARVDAIVKAGRLLPKHKQHTVDFAMSLVDGEAVIDFGEGDKAKKVTQREAYLLQLEGAAKVVEFGELAAHDDGPSEATFAEAESNLFKQVASGGAAVK
jgi:hypothetical protein